MQEALRELAAIRGQIDQLEIRTLLSGEYDSREALITINAQAGGADAADWAEGLQRIYLRWAERHGYPTEVYDTSYAEEAGIKSTTFAVKAPYAYGTLRGEHGTHRMVRISKYDNQGRGRPRSPGWTSSRSSSRPTTSTFPTTSCGSTSTGQAAQAARA